MDLRKNWWRPQLTESLEENPMSQKISLSAKEWQAINDVLRKDLFEFVNEITIEHSGPISGLGYTLTLSFDYHIDGVNGKFSTEITNEEHW